MSGAAGGLAPGLLSLAMLGAFALGGGGVWLLTTRRERQKGLLMLAVAVVILGNVLIWAV